MSREQRRLDRKQRGGGVPDRRTPVKAPSGGGGLPWPQIAIAAGVLLIIGLIAYVVTQQSSGDGDNTPAWEKAEADDSPDLPGTFVPSQGRGHFNYTFSLERTPRPFCPGVRASDPASVLSESGTPAPTNTPAPTSPAGAGGTPGAMGSPVAASTEAPRTDCYASNPPTSGEHLGVQRNVDVTGNGTFMNIPADPDVYPDDVVTPREAVAHILEHAGVFVGWNCADGDTACMDVVDELKDLVNDRIDNHDNRVVMARDPDLPVGEIGLAAWTRVLNVTYQDFDKDEAERFIGTYSCRFDPEGFC